MAEASDTADAVDALLDAAGRVDCDGLRVVRAHEGYTVAVPERTRGRLDAAEARAVLADHRAYATNWRYWERRVGGRGTARRAFLRWVERADELPVPGRYAALDDGTSRTWGQLRITARLVGDRGERRYGVCHVDDAGTSDLDTYRDPLALREVVERDERGRYRPLKTAPTLRRGWRCVDLDADGLVRAVEAVYPATVANWHRERTGALDVTHWRDAADRQTGIYDAVEELSEEQVAWLAEACCVDSQCLKRREWDLTDSDPLDAPRGDGEFPCREPCSLVIAAARAFRGFDAGETRTYTLDAGETRTYTLELTPAEFEQVTGLLEAVAEGRAGEAREADFDDPANRYRARYLRAKRDGIGQDEAETK